MEQIIARELEKCNECNKDFMNQRALRMHNITKHKGEINMKEQPFNHIEGISYPNPNYISHNEIKKEIKSPELLDAGIWTIKENKIQRLDLEEEVVLKFDKNSIILNEVLPNLNHILLIKPVLIDLLKRIESLELAKEEIEDLNKELVK